MKQLLLLSLLCSTISGCAQIQTRDASETVLMDRVPIMVAARIRDNQALLPDMKVPESAVQLADGRVMLNQNIDRASLRAAPIAEIKFVAADREVSVAPAVVSVEAEDKPEALFDAAAYDVEIFDVAAVELDYEVELFTPIAFDPREARFVNLSGPSDQADWQACETDAQGYLRLADSEITLNPEFEVCMRNKGYVLADYAGVTGDADTVSAPRATKIASLDESLIPQLETPKHDARASASPAVSLTP